MIRQSVCTGRTFSTSSIQREVIQAQGHTGSNQNWTLSCSGACCSGACALMLAPMRSALSLFWPLTDRDGRPAWPEPQPLQEQHDRRGHRAVGLIVERVVPPGFSPSGSF